MMNRIALLERSALLSAELKRRAFEEGFDKVGIVAASRLGPESELLEEWLRREYEGEMSWMAHDPQKRTVPREIFPTARSVVVVALNYYTAPQHSSTPETGKVSRYAWGDDYHEVVAGKLRSLLDWIKQQVPEADGKVCVDIQPMMDKAWAVRAGVGWLGKHSNVITHEFGSWVFLGELLLNIDLQYETERVDDHCGSCTLCIDACPTQAIVEPYVVDSRRCISYVTIESREQKIPEAIATALEGWLYGCDICQDVCPWNRFPVETAESRFQPRDGNVDANLCDILELSPESYAERFRHSAMKRAKLPGLQRNARALLEQPSRVNSK